MGAPGPRAKPIAYGMGGEQNASMPSLATDPGPGHVTLRFERPVGPDSPPSWCVAVAAGELAPGPAGVAFLWGARQAGGITPCRSPLRRDPGAAEDGRLDGDSESLPEPTHRLVAGIPGRRVPPGQSSPGHKHQLLRAGRSLPPCKGPEMLRWRLIRGERHPCSAGPWPGARQTAQGPWSSTPLASPTERYAIVAHSSGDEPSPPCPRDAPATWPESPELLQGLSEREPEAIRQVVDPGVGPQCVAGGAL